MTYKLRWDIVGIWILSCVCGYTLNYLAFGILMVLMAYRYILYDALDCIKSQNLHAKERNEYINELLERLYK